MEGIQTIRADATNVGVVTKEQLEQTLPQTEGLSPLDWVKQMSGEEAPVPKEVPAVKVETAPRAEEPTPNTPEPVVEEKPVVEKPLDDAEPSEEEEDKEDQELEGVDPNPIAKSYKNLKAVHREAKETIATITKEKEELKAKIAQYDTGEVYPEIVQTLQEEIKELEKYRVLHDLKSSRDYREKFVEPVKALKDDIYLKAEEYGVPEEVIEEVMSTPDKKAQGLFIQRYFGTVDEDDAYEIRQKLKQIRSIELQAKEAEKDPVRISEQLREERGVIEEQARVERAKKAHDVSRKGWLSGLAKIRAEGKALELIPKTNDEKFNQSIVKPLVDQASLDFSRFMTDLVNRGLSEVTEEWAASVAEIFLRAQSTATAYDTRNNAVEELNRIQAEQVQSKKYERPWVGRANGSIQSSRQEAHVPGTGPHNRSRDMKSNYENAADEILKSVGAYK